MSNEEIVRAWKDAAYRQRLSDEEQALLPEHPAGAIELTDDALQEAAGGDSIFCPTELWSYCDTGCFGTQACICPGPAPTALGE